MRRISPAMIVALIALMFSLAGTSYAVTQLPNNSVGTVQIKNSAVTSKKIKDGSVAPVDLTAAAKATLQGAKGDTGATGGPGVNKIASLSENPTDVILSNGSQTVMTTTITTTVTTTLAIHGTLNIYNNSTGTAAARDPDRAQPLGRNRAVRHIAEERIDHRHAVQQHQRAAGGIAAQRTQGGALR